MPKHLIKRYLPDPEKIAGMPGLGFMRHRLEDPSLWHLNRRSASGAMFWGVWFAFLPMPFQTVPAAAAALIFRVNLPLCILLCWLTNPLTLLPCIWLGYSVGALILGKPLLDLEQIREVIRHLGQLLSPDAVAGRAQGSLSRHVAPFLLGMPVTGLILGFLSYLGMNAYWRHHVARAWRQRAERRSRQATATHGKDAIR